MTEFEIIYEKWHDYAKGRDVASLIDLYSEDAVFESPLVPAILDQQSGVLRGRTEIRRFLEEGTRRRPDDLVRLRADTRYAAGSPLRSAPAEVGRQAKWRRSSKTRRCWEGIATYPQTYAESTYRALPSL